MSAVCNTKFLTKSCECLTDPMDPTNPICAYVSTDNGLVYPCDVGCCQPNCGTKPGHLPRMDVEFRQTFGGTLPPGFNVHLATNGNTDRKNEAPFSPIQDDSGKVKEIALRVALSLLVVLVFAIYIGLKT